MNMLLLEQLGLLLIFFLGSWFFSGFESGIVSINRHRLVHRMRHGDRKARKLAAILRDPHRLLATTLVGNNICNVSLSTISSAIAYWIADCFVYDRDLMMGAATLAIAVMMLIVGEYLPKLWFSSRPIERTGRVLWIFLVLRTVLYPLASLCMFITRLVAPRTKDKSPFVSRETIDFLSRDSEAQGQISAFERLMIKRVLDLQIRKASQIMTPLARVDRVYESDNLATVLRVFRQTHHRILPMFSDDGKRCLGVVHLFDLLRSRTANPIPFDLRRPPVFVLRDTPADDLLPYMRVRATKILIVRDGEEPIGIVSQEDVLHAVLDDKLLNSSTDRRPAASAPGDETDG